MKDLCAISYGQILMIGADGESHLEAQAIPLDKIYLNNLITQIV